MLNFGGESQIWVKAAIGADVGVFKVSNFLTGSLELGSVSDDNLNDNGGIVTIYNTIRDNSHTYIGNLNVIDGNVGIGTDLPSEKLSVNGKIRAREIKVEATNWPDYVFEEGYKVGTLQELESYIKANKHLPEMSSAREIETNGVALGEMNKLLLKKIEELTLHLIEEHNRAVVRDKEMDELKTLLKQQQKHLNEIELKLKKDEKQNR
ncbi:MAG: hypothetical protein J7577_18440 [Sphingobacteriaceae bacterium]|nr:hypothetical protein [Sphingobacteriaceae bacterium]